MTDVKPRASGPLWAQIVGNGSLLAWTAKNEPSEYVTAPCRLIPGHGKVVPLELVEAIMAAHDDWRLCDDEDEWIDTHEVLRAAIRAAIEGAL